MMMVRRRKRILYPEPFVFPPYGPFAYLYRFLRRKHENNKQAKHFYNKRWFKISAVIGLAIVVVYFKERQVSSTLLLARLFDGLLDVTADSAFKER